MPELPEVETTLRGLKKLLVGRTLAKVTVRTKQLRFPFPPHFKKRLEGRIVKSASRRAKYMLFTLDSGETLLVHLGMSGRMVKGVRGADFAKHDHVIFETDKGEQIRFHDPRRFGIIDIITAGDDEHKLLASIGPEPLDDAFDAPYLASALKNKKSPIKTLLLDQRIVAGLGNIYVSEALFHARIKPERSGNSIKQPEIAKLVPAIKNVLIAAIDAGGTSMRDYVQADGVMGNFQNHFAVYDRENTPCPACRKPVLRIVQSGRSSFYCAKCQK